MVKIKVLGWMCLSRFHSMKKKRGGVIWTSENRSDLQHSFLMTEFSLNIPAYLENIVISLGVSD